MEMVERVYMNNTKIANQLRKYRDLEKTLNQINVGRQGGEKIYVWYVISQSLSAFDCMVADMVYTLSRRPDWDGTFTLGQILCVLSGNPAKTLTAARREELRESVERLCATELDINCSEELVHRKLQREDGGRIRGIFLDAVPAGRCRYRVTEKEPFMPLYEYASKVNRQIISFESRYLSQEPAEGGGKLSGTREVMLIRYYLIRRIELMRNPKNNFKANDIAYVRKGQADAGMLPEIGIDFSDCHSDAARRHKRQRIHRIVGQLLENYCSMGYIRGYEEKKDEKGFRIDCGGV